MESLRELLAGRYDLSDVVGRGGMGVVYRATDRVLARTVAVKVLRGDMAADPALVARFEREARAAGALNNPNIVAVYDTGRELDTHFIVMEYVDGPSLARLVRRRGRLAPAEVVRIGVQIARALGAAHRAGIVHRDIKPANVMLDASGTVKVLDFGIARVAQGTTLTQTSVVLGSVPYLAPEIARGEPATARSDIYSLGCVLYELLTGGPPFRGELAAAVMHQHDTAEPVRPSDLEPLVPVALDALVMRLLAKRPEDRPASAREVAGALARLEEPTRPRVAAAPARLEATATRRRVAAAPARRVATAPRGPVATAPRRRVAGAPPPTSPTRLLRPARASRGPGRIVAVVLLVLALAGVLVAVLGSAGARPRRAASHARHRATRHHVAAPTPTHTHSHTVATTPRAPTSKRKPAPTPPPRPAPLTVPTAIGALTTLLAQDLQSGAIDQHGQDLLSHLQDILNSYEQGNTSDALHKIDDLVKHLGDLAGHGDISSSALPAITAGIDRLRAALSQSAPPATGPSGAPPGHGGPHDNHSPNGPDHPHGQGQGQGGD